MIWAEVAPTVFGLLSAAVWGAGDFCGGLATRRANVYGVVIVGDAIGGLLFVSLALAVGEKVPPLADMVWAAAAGVCGAIGLLALYRALASRRMSLASPAAAVISAALPAVFGTFVDGFPGGWQIGGFGLALLGVWLVSSNEQAKIRLGELGLPIVAGLGFGLFFILMDRVSAAAVFWPLVSARIVAVIVLAAFALGTRQLVWPAREHWPLTAMVGIFDAGGNAFFLLATQAGRLDVASVLSSLYPASTVWLAWLILKERITRWQLVGVLAALAAIVLITV
ncbi:MAG: DMT family transporter [Chloroflexi bacterium]|nr:DMT family transporter [Chloroflexota bacterium]